MIDQTIPVKMDEEVVRLLHGIVDIRENVEKVSNYPWNLEDKQKVVNQLSEFLEVANQFKQRVRGRSPVISANRILALECIATCWLEELEMWIDLKNEEYDEAWDHLITAQDFAESVAGADRRFAEKFHMKSYQKRLNVIEKIVFPQQVFVSPGMTIGSSKCSICGENYQDCDHIQGLAYNGEFCKVIMEEIRSADHLAIVDEPEDKRARVTAPSMMTGLPEEEIDVLDEVDE